MPLRPDVPVQSREALEAWFREKASDPAVFAKLQSDFHGTVAALIGVPPPASLDVQLHIEQPDQPVAVNRFGGGTFGSDGNPVPLTGGGQQVISGQQAAEGRPGGVPSIGVSKATVQPGGNVTVLQESATRRFLVLRPPPGVAPAAPGEQK